MPLAKRSRRLTLLVLAAYLAANSLGMLWHEHVHSHAAADACCHAHLHGSGGHGNDGHKQDSSPLPASDSTGPRFTATQDAHDCVVCRVTGQPVVAAVAVVVELSALVAPDPLPCPAAAPRSLAARLARSRAPPAAAV